MVARDDAGIEAHAAESRSDGALRDSPCGSLALETLEPALEAARAARHGECREGKRQDDHEAGHGRKTTKDGFGGNPCTAIHRRPLPSPAVCHWSVHCPRFARLDA